MTNSTKTPTRRKPFVVGTTNTRIPLEKWSRGELEDQFHALYSRNLELAQKSGNLEKTIKNLNGQLKRFAGRATTKNEDWELERRDLERKNNLLSQKLKSLKHQLLVYTRPTAQSATINFLTSRNTATGRPKSALAHTNRPHDHSSMQNQQRLAEADSSIPHDYPKRPSTSTGFVTSSNILQNTADKINLIRLNRELRDYKERAEILRFESDKHKSKLDKLQTAYDNLEEELANTRQILKDFEESTKSLRADARRSNESSLTHSQIAEKEVKLLRDEVKLLRSNNEKLEAGIFEKETATKSTISELSRLKAHIQELEHSLSVVERQKQELEEKKVDAEFDRAKIASKYKKLRASLEKLETGQQQSIAAEQSISASLEKAKESKRSHPKEHRKSAEPKESIVSSAGILDRLFDDVVSIVDSHLAQSSNGTDTDEHQQLRSGNIKWQQIYEQMYSELEKVRNMLITEYDMNKELTNEKAQLNREFEQKREYYEAEINELKVQIQKYRNEIEMLENQLRSIVGGSSLNGDGTLTELTTHSNNSDITLRFTHLLVTDAGLKLSNTAIPSVFLLLEFFDFEFQITPLIQGPDARFQYSTVYDICVSDLFVHYLETDAINVEVYEVRGATHEQWGSGRISLKSLLTSKTPTKINGQLEVRGLNSDAVISMLDYTIEVPFQLMKALQAQKRRKTAATYLPVDVENLNDYNSLIIQIHRCSNLDKLLSGNSRPPSVYIAYEIYDLSAHTTKTIPSNVDPEFNDSRSWTLPIGQPLHKYLKAEELHILLVDENQLETNKTALSTLSIPLFPLTRNQKIMRTFPLATADGTLTDATMDISIYWKHAYTFNDEDLEVREKTTKPAAIKETKTIIPSNQPIQLIDKKDYKDVIDVPIKSLKQPQKLDIAAKPPLPKPLIGQNSRSQGSSSSQSDESTPRPIVKSSESSSEDAESVILVESPDLNQKEVPSEIKETPAEPRKKRPAPPPPIEEEPKPEPKPRNKAVDPIELKRRLSQEIIASTSANNTRPAYDPDLKDAPLSIVPLALLNDADEAEVEIETPSPASYHSSADSNTTYTQEQTADELQRPQILEITDDMLVDSEEEKEKTKEELPQPARRSLLGQLPPLTQPTPAQRRQSANSSRAVDFSDPLHSSIPPSETSEQSENSTDRDETRKKPQRPPRTQPQLNEPTTPSALRLRPSVSALDSKSDDVLPDAIVKLRILRIQLLDHSALLATDFDDAMCFVEWSFLDFERELCETPQNIQLPRDSQQTMDFMTENIYELNWRRVALLRQWMSLAIKLKFVLVLDNATDQQQNTQAGDTMDDIAEASFDLQEVIDSTHHVISLFDAVDMEPVANLEFEIDFSDNLWTYFEELAASEHATHNE